MGGGVEFGKYKRKMMNAAEQLGYGREVKYKIKNAKSDMEISDIMTKARKAQMMNG